MQNTLKVGDLGSIVAPQLDAYSKSIGIGVYDPVTVTKIEGDKVTFTYVDANSGEEMEGQCSLEHITKKV